MRLLIVGGGWAGLSAAVRAVERGWQVSLLEASRTLGGRARTLLSPTTGLSTREDKEQSPALDNGQHILIGAYDQTLALMQTLGLNPSELLQRQPLQLQSPDGSGLALPALPPPWNLLLGVARARGWGWHDRWSLVRTAARWQRQGFSCPPTWNVAQCCATLSPRVMETLIAPLCVSALNTPVDQASGEVFLRVLRNALWSGPDASDLLLPRVDLGRLLPEGALRWLQARGAQVLLGQRWRGPGDEPAPAHEAVLLACPAWEAARLTQHLNPTWSTQASSLQHSAIATVYLQHPDPHFKGLHPTMLALPSDAQYPAQFVFDRGSLLGPSSHGVLAFVVSASQGSTDAIEHAVLQQAQHQLGLAGLRPLRTVVEKRATFACTPGLQRPPAAIAQAWWACGDYVEGPYPATLEGAVRSGAEVIDQIAQSRQGERRR